MKKTAAVILSITCILFALCACQAGGDSLLPGPTASPQISQTPGAGDRTPPQASQNPSGSEAKNPAFTEQFGDFETTDLDGNPCSQALFADSKLTMINIWGTFCSPCLAEMPDLGELSEEYREKGLQIIGIVTDVTDQNGNILQTQVDLAKSLAEQTGAKYLHLLPSASLIDAKLNSVYAIPETVFVNKDGYLVGKPIIGSQAKEEWQSIIDERLALVS